MRLNLLAIFLSGAIVAAALPAAADTVALDPQSQTQPAAKLVILAVVVETDGTVSNATVEKSSGVQAADFAAIDHARHLKLPPLMVNGVPIRTQKKIAIAVKARDPQAQQPQPASPVGKPTIAFPPIIDV